MAVSFMRESWNLALEAHLLSNWDSVTECNGRYTLQEVLAQQEYKRDE